MATGCGSLYVTINEDEQGLFEVFAAMGKGGGCAASQTEAVSRLISLALRSGIDREQIVKQIKGVRCPNQAWEKGGRIYSCADAIAKALERHNGGGTHGRGPGGKPCTKRPRISGGDKRQGQRHGHGGRVPGLPRSAGIRIRVLGLPRLRVFALRIGL